MTRTNRLMTLTGLVAAGAVLAACGSSDGGSSDSGSAATTTETTRSAVVDSDDSADADLIAAALAGGDPVTCDISYDDGSTGVAYLAGLTSLRMEMDDPEIGKMSFLIDDDVVYVWGTDDSTGVAFDEEIAEELDFYPEAEDLLDDDAEDQTTECSVYTGRSGVFSAPNSVDFTSIETDADLFLWLTDEMDSSNPSVFAQLMLAELDPAEQAELVEIAELLEDMTPAEQAEFLDSIF